MKLQIAIPFFVFESGLIGTMQMRKTFVKLKANSGTTPCLTYKAQKFSSKKQLTLAEMQKLPDIEESASMRFFLPEVDRIQR